MKNSIKFLCSLLLITSFSCFNEEVDLSPLLAEDEITVDSELYNNIERVTDDDPENNLVCIDFDYVFTLNVYNEEDEFIGIQIVGSDLEFSTFLESLQDGYSISISYPITSITEDGETIEITNNDELQIVIDNCIDEEEQLGYCNGLLTEEDCIWRVIFNEEDDANNDFENAIFDVSTIGTVIFTHEDVAYNGTWITFFIGDELHLNINLDDDATVAEHWNFDWKNTIIDENNMILVNDDGLTFYIQRECEEEEECATFEFEECELNQDEGIAEFLLEDYVECLANFIEYDITESTVVSFHLTQIDAESNTNAIPTDSVFLNTINPQFLFARFEDTDTMEVVYTSIKLTAIDCEE